MPRLNDLCTVKITHVRRKMREAGLAKKYGREAGPAMAAVVDVVMAHLYKHVAEVVTADKKTGVTAKHLAKTMDKHRALRQLWAGGFQSNRRPVRKAKAKAPQPREGVSLV